MSTDGHFDIEGMINAILAYNPNSDTKLIRKAIQKCREWHGSQKRKSGEPYYMHPVAVANDIIKMQLDDTSIITALLHDVLEDTPITFNDLVLEFSMEVAELVDGITKLDKINFQIDQIKQAENFRKLFLALAKDIRVLIVKLFDRLHNMRTIIYKNSGSVKRIAVETLEIYAPLAERIGMYDVSSELQDLAFGAINARARNSVVRRLEQLKEKSENGDLVDYVIKELEGLLRKNNIKCTVKGREKSPYSIWRKLIKKGTTFDKLIDVVGFRIITENYLDCYSVLGMIHTTYRAVPDTFVDYISLPKANGYKSIHTAVIGPKAQRIEIQIRDRAMDIEAEYGFAAHWSYKQSISHALDLKKSMKIWVETMLDILKSTNNAEEFLETTKLEMYTDQIFAFTPEGDIIDLPRGATILDFAFAIHSDIGCLCDGAKIGGVFVGKDYKIKNGDQVYIITSKAIWPTLDWMNMVITGRARHAIRRATREEQMAQIKAKGSHILSTVFARYGHKVTNEKIQKIMEFTGSVSYDNLFLDIANNVFDISSVVKKAFPEILYVGNAFLDIDSFDGITEDRSVRDNPIDDIKYSIPKYKVINLPECFVTKIACCCKPHIGDSVIGVSIPSEAIFLHKENCETTKYSNLSDYIVIRHLVLTL